MVERSLPLVSEPVSAIAWATVRSLLRAPEVKLMLLGPLTMLVIFGGTMLMNTGGQNIPGLFRSLVPLGVLAFSISGLAQLSHNCFGFDRAGFRAYVQSGVPRDKILIGKNLALFPLVLVLTLPPLLIAQGVVPAPWTHFIAILLEIPTVYLVLSLLGNYSSIQYPVCQAAGSMRPGRVKGITMLVHFLFGLATFIVLGLVAGLPLGIEILLQFAIGLNAYVPVALSIALVELAASVLLYQAVVRGQGDLLQSRECQILQTVTEQGE